MCDFLIKIIKAKNKKYQLKKSEVSAVEWGLSIGMGAMFFSAIDRLSLQQQSMSLYERLHASYLASIFSAQDQSAALLEIMLHSSELQIPLCLLKGMSVSQQYYPQSYFRLMRDMDILLHPDDVIKFETMLLELGYQRSSENSAAYYQEHHHTMPFYCKEKNVWVEVHSLLFREGSWRSKIPAFSIENIRAEFLPSSFEGQEIKRLSAELQLVYIASHWMEDFKPKGGLFALSDVMFLLRHERHFDWSKLLKWTGESKSLALPVYLLLSNLNRFQLTEISPKTLSILSVHCGYGWWFKVFVFNQILNDFYLREGLFGRLINASTLDVIRSEVSVPSRVPFSLRVIWKILFPQVSEQRYSLSWQWRRVKKIVQKN